MNLNWQTKHFTQLSTSELYSIMQLRLEVFSVEQNCAYQDADGKDQKAFHLLGYDSENTLLAYARILPAGVSFKEVSIGRVITKKNNRNKGFGKILMKESLKFMSEQFGGVPIRISAQCYLESFYKNFGFIVDGKEYLEDNIPHIEMIRN